MVSTYITLAIIFCTALACIVFFYKVRRKDPNVFPYPRAKKLTRAERERMRIKNEENRKAVDNLLAFDESEIYKN